MRVVVPALLACLIVAGEAAAGSFCSEPDKVMQSAPTPVSAEHYSSFRGISLASRPDNVRWSAQSLGFDTATSYFVGSDTVSAIAIGDSRDEVGRAEFDRNGKMMRLALKLPFFSDKPIFVRKFADDLFELYHVLSSSVVDDVCFQDVTCFRGVSKFGEQFLIMRIGTDVELYVRPDNINPAGG